MALNGPFPFKKLKNTQKSVKEKRFRKVKQKSSKTNNTYQKKKKLKKKNYKTLKTEDNQAKGNKQRKNKNSLYIRWAAILRQVWQHVTWAWISKNGHAPFLRGIGN